MDRQWKSIHANPPKNWQEVWSKRIKLCRFDNKNQAQKFIEKNVDKYTEGLLIGIHPKDGYVVYQASKSL